MSENREKMKRKMLILICVLPIVLGIIALLLNLLVILPVKSAVYTDIADVPSAQTALLLGARVYSENRVSQIVYDRLVRTAELYKAGKVTKILVSGDHGRKGYDEVNTMKEWLIDFGVPAKDIFLDHAGFSTYESIYRAKEIFGVQSLIIVTQRFHLYRALYIAAAFEIESKGLAADRVRYRSAFYNQLREAAARIKDFFYARVFRPQPAYLGEKIPITGDGRLTQE
jgi:vancomycin permeability regulator SanA